MSFCHFLIESIFLGIGLIGLAGIVQTSFYSEDVQRYWFVFVASLSIFALRAFVKPTLKMPERLGFLGFIGFLGYLSIMPELQFLRPLFSFFGFGGFFGFLGRHGLKK
jgi:hypothetical protein